MERQIVLGVHRETWRISTEIPSSQSSPPLGVSLIGPCLGLWLPVSFQDTFPISSFESSRSSSCPQLAYFTGHGKHLQVRISQNANIRAPWEQERKVNSRFPQQTHWVRNTATCSLTSLLNESKACFQMKLTSSLKTERGSLIFVTQAARWGGKKKILLLMPPGNPLVIKPFCQEKHVCGGGARWGGGGDSPSEPNCCRQMHIEKCKSESFSCSVLSDSLQTPLDCSLPGSSLHGILQTRILEWVDLPFSRGSFSPREWTQVSCIAGKFFSIWARREANA